MTDTGSDPAPRLALLGVWMRVALGEEYCLSVIRRVLGSRKQVSNEARQALDSAINGAVKDIPQFPKKPAIAPPAFLVEPVMHAMVQSDKLTGAVLRAWSESHAELHDVVVERLGDIGVDAAYPNFSENRLRGLWPPADWEAQLDQFAEDHAGFDKDDLALMMCYTSGKVPNFSDASEADVDFSGWLDEMRALPADEPAWREAREFIESAREVIDAKEREFNETGIRLLGKGIEEIGQRFAAELTYLERTVGSWSLDGLPTSSVSQLTDSIENLKEAMEEYQPVREHAPVRSEELARAEERSELEAKILSLMNEVDQVMAGSVQEAVEVDGSPADEDSARRQAEAEIETARQAEVEAVRQRAEAEVEAARQQSEAEVEAARKQAEAEVTAARQQSEAEVEAARKRAAAENEDIRQEMKSLRNELRASQSQEESWRLAYVEASRQRSVEDGEDEPAAIGSVAEAAHLAEKMFAAELLFRPNSRSDIKDNPFEDPKAVFDALRWLATVYYRSRMGESNLADPDSSIREACGWSYKSHQSTLTMNRFKNWYTTRVDGKIRWLGEHIGKGTSKDPRHTIRIGFDWDKERKAVIVGFIGRHQQTTVT